MLKYFRDSYVWEGVEERYDQLLYDCFGVKVTSSDCMICDWCVRALRGTEKFRALVHAAFDPTASASDMAIDTDASSTLITIRTNSCQTTNIGSEQRSRLEKQEQQMISKKVDTQRKRTLKKMVGRQDIINKRTIVNCEICNQKYPMMVPNGVCKAFTCSRCNKNRDSKNAVCKKCNIVMPKNMFKDHMEMHVKADVRATSRLMQHKKLLHSSRTKIVMVPKPRNQCTKDSKKYYSVGRQAEHVKDMKEVFDDNEKYTSNYDEDLNSKQHEESQMYPASHHCREHHYILENEIK
ncbi:unnamed protein product [Arctia plantaginis]|uniref:Uncharacterized protein n=1 Tax=Arctia plantaginis TaxID=874455 RepID=A0A8S0YWT5_ARCPL|nr:unnamed protein product [Arctia plantaginis]